jgi:mRNA interferase RelE/StbE
VRTIIWTHEAARQFLALSTEVQDRIEAKLDQLAMNPSALTNQIKPLKGVKALRLRVGDYRVIFTDEGVILMILKVGHRRDIYE